MPSSLAGRLVLLLLFANAPAALLAIGAGIASHEQSRERAEQTLLQHAQLVAARAGLIFSTAHGVMETLSANAEILDGGPRCNELLQAALAAQSDYLGIILGGENARPICAAGELGDPDQMREVFANATERGLGGRGIIFLPHDIKPESEFVTVSKLLRTDGPRTMAVVMRRSTLDAVFGGEAQSGRVSALIRPAGQIAFEEDRRRTSESWLPENVGKITGGESTTLTEPSVSGADYFYAMAPIRGVQTSAVVATPVRTLDTIDWLRFVTWAGPPILILAMAILAIFIGINRLVLRWIARMRQVTAQYAAGNFTTRMENLDRAPREIMELGTGLNAMADAIEERSQALVVALDGKNGLLRELHHRVKNNFQMIASLLSLQRRELPSRLRILLRVPEDRVLAMASAYKASYASGEIGRVPLVELLRDISGQLRQSFGLAAPIVTLDHADEVSLDLDRAVPLGLLISEIITVALDRAATDIRPIAISVTREDDNRLRVDLTGEALAAALPQDGLSARLVQAYQAQLGARLSTPDDASIVLAMSIEATPPARPGRVELGG